MKENLQTRLISLAREIEALKAATRVPSTLRMYHYSVEITAENGLPQGVQGIVYAGTHLFRITYADGDNDIITEFLSAGTVWAETPSGNTQLCQLYTQYTGHILRITSTRPILSVEFLQG